MMPALTVMMVTLPHAGVSQHSGNGRRHGTQVIVPFQDELPYFLMPPFPPCFTQASFRSKAHSCGRCLGGFTDTGQAAGSLPASIVASEPVAEYTGRGRRWELQMASTCSRKGGGSPWLSWRWSACCFYLCCSPGLCVW